MIHYSTNTELLLCAWLYSRPWRQEYRSEQAIKIPALVEQTFY